MLSGSKPLVEAMLTKFLWPHMASPECNLLTKFHDILQDPSAAIVKNVIGENVSKIMKNPRNLG